MQCARALPLDPEPRAETMFGGGNMPPSDTKGKAMTIRIRKCTSGWVVRRNVWKTLSTRKDAEAFALHLESAMAEVQRRFDAQTKPCCRIRDRIEEFLADCAIGLQRRSCNPDTIKTHRKRLLAFDAAFHSRPLDAITREEVEGWMKRRKRGASGRAGVAPDTVNADLVSLKAFARWAQAKGHAPALLPFLTVGKLRINGKIAGTNRKPPKAMEMAEVLALLGKIKSMREDVALFLEGMVLFCLRPHALWKLRRGDVKLPVNGTPGSLKSIPLKGYHERLLPIFPDSQQHAWARECIALFRRRHRRSPRPHDPLLICLPGRSKVNPGGWTTATLDRAVAAICKKLGVTFTVYQVRHSVISWLHQNPGMSPAATQAAAAHSSITTQDAYGKRHGREALPAYHALSVLVANHRNDNRAPEGKAGGVLAVCGA